MKRIVMVASAIGVAFLTTAFVAAQQQGKGQKGPGQPGQTGQYHGPIGQTPWFGNQEIRQQLKFNDNDFNRLNKAYGSAWTGYQKGMSEMPTTLTPEQRAEKMQELQQNFYKSYSAATNEIITDPQTRARYNQLNLQYRGYDAFYDPMVQEKLTLTTEQRQQLGQYRQEWHKSMGDLNRDYGTDREGVTKRFGEMNKRERERMEKILTEQQRKTWRELTGEPYNFQPNVYFQTTAPKQDK